MDFPVTLFPPALFWAANIALLGVFLAALWRAPFGRLRIRAFSHVFSAACVVLLVLWNTRVGVLPALNFHLLGVTALTLMFGWAFAVFGVLLVAIGSLINQQGDWLSLGLNTLVMGGVPILITETLLRVAQRRLPHNFFIYIYVNGFLTAGLSILGASLLGAALMWLADAHSGEWLSYQYLPYLPLVLFSEAFVNGTIMTALVAVRPGWVASFDDERYIHNK